MKKLTLTLLILIFSLSLQARIKTVSGWNYTNKSDLNLEWAKLKDNKVIVFLNSQCPCSQAHFDHLNELQKANKEFQFIGFHSNKLVDKNVAQKYFDKYKIDFPIFDDIKLVYANEFKALKTPHVFVLDKDENLLFQGGATNSRRFASASKFYLKTALLEINNNKAVSTPNARALGCYIAR